jgi:hypothetical protein
MMIAVVAAAEDHASILHAILVHVHEESFAEQESETEA